jgi:hypothetical protein
MCIFHKADVNPKNKEVPTSFRMNNIKGNTPLHYVCKKGNREGLIILLTAGADVNVKDNDVSIIVVLLIYVGYHTITLGCQWPHQDGRIAYTTRC